MGKHSKQSKIFKNVNYKNEENILDHSRRKRKMPFSQKCLLFIFTITFIISGIILLKWYINTGDSEKTYKELAKNVIEIKEEKSSSPIDFDKLKETNSDVVAWIKIDGTTIDYPVMQKSDNSYYLTKNFYNENDRTGSIFLDYKNKKDFTDKNTVIYGHNIKRGTMFADLVDIYNGTFGDNIEINIYTPSKLLKFKVFSSYSVEPEDYGINTSIMEKDFNSFKQTLIQKSERKFKDVLNGSNQILTLSTCDRTGRKRVLVHAELMN